MTKPAQKITATTQAFIEIQDIVDDVVILSGGNACLVIEIKAVNFSLLSFEEQGIRISSYGTLLNSLSFPIQILIRNKKENVSAYMKLLETQATQTKNPQLSDYITQYKAFVENLIKENVILDKKFYIVISLSSLELGLSHAFKTDDFAVAAKIALRTKAESLLTQLNRLSLPAKVLEKEELIRLFYEIFNQTEGTIDASMSQQDMQTPVVKGGGGK